VQVRAEALDAHLEKSLASLYVIASDEHLLAMEARIVFVKKHAARDFQNAKY